jgi:putative transcriptional regulator
VITNRLRELREQQLQKTRQSEVWTQEGLAQRVGVSRQTVIAIEKGSYNPSLELAFKLARTFGLTIEDLFTYGDDRPETRP